MIPQNNPTTHSDAIDRQNTYKNDWNISTNSADFTMIKLGGRMAEEFVTDTDIHETKNAGHILRLKITTTSYSGRMTDR